MIPSYVYAALTEQVTACLKDFKLKGRGGNFKKTNTVLETNLFIYLLYIVSHKQVLELLTSQLQIHALSLRNTYWQKNVKNMKAWHMNSKTF